MITHSSVCYQRLLELSARIHKEIVTYPCFRLSKDDSNCSGEYLKILYHFLISVYGKVFQIFYNTI